MAGVIEAQAFLPGSDATQSVTGCIPTRSVGTIFKFSVVICVSLAACSLQLAAALLKLPHHPPGKPVNLAQPGQVHQLDFA
ncbi:Superfamily II DNA or RNA helicase [Pseudomonas syringae pv. actinidiae]|uniref:Superfamily II DNA or RNA helicase n=1 Tax=Pseudomonas syringae pv. actinidiae TaxID=103796 RepID=A0A2V0QK98_PSESF|nr:Superfamily II DNA or RNA helicase [Pseudomonas syringae pv. actinidiae]